MLLGLLAGGRPGRWPSSTRRPCCVGRGWTTGWRPTCTTRRAPSRLLGTRPSADAVPRPSSGSSARPSATAPGWSTGCSAGRVAVRRRLDALAAARRVEDFRVEQVRLGRRRAARRALAIDACSSPADSGQPAVRRCCSACAGLVGGVLARDWWLTQQVRAARGTDARRVPDVAELLALAVTAGESPVGALERVTRLSRRRARPRAGPRARPTPGPARRSSRRCSGSPTGPRCAPLARFVDGLAVAVERGTPLAEVLRAQAADVREAGQAGRLLEAGGRKEIAMMVPVVFLVLPVTVLFALFPGFYGFSFAS